MLKAAEYQHKAGACNTTSFISLQKNRFTFELREQRSELPKLQYKSAKVHNEHAFNEPMNQRREGTCFLNIFVP